MFLLCSSDFGRSLEESRDDLQSLGSDTPVPLIRSDSYTTLLDATGGGDGDLESFGSPSQRPAILDDAPSQAQATGF
ncbi:hypothetical protein MPSYJ_48670 [Mycolicibacterium psychrotolerans]|uniref:Uncharacterized protein n=1 Tax=Mycolicibacterium psychrotolerans TaxID=216929 RepID=A0A7I7MH26_9MYCO|nr:hypothetical protein MPSYJ_48670 [Mycolicibacterium psychrotolerans]